ncbi:Protein MEMO1 -like protein [Escovopsis weberi]|uniref:Protein MEMO1-like protein n=1 Tax=Escovopsis weberi TaxID=150374 RepID=A0A0M8MSM5_ESCWE|nr:Protein MEMO1 -like protein [Escovopsis weberi]
MGAYPDGYLDMRPARKAGSVGDRAGDRGWYNENAAELSAQLDDFLANVPDTIDGSSLPVPGARVIIAPYSGQTAAWAYSCLDLSNVKRVFILGPSHHADFEGCRVTQYSAWATPCGALTVDQEVLRELREEGGLFAMDPDDDAEEHSLELHAPYVYKRCEQSFGSPGSFPKIAPIIVGRTGSAAQQDYGRLLLPYLKDPENAFVISSDFCHWGSWFSFMPYSRERDLHNPRHLTRHDRRPSGPPIHEYIEAMDKHAMDAVESGSQDAFTESIRLTRNTVCGRYPIGIAMAALELYSREVKESRFKVIQYDRSEMVTLPSQTSVSYVSAYAVL